MAVVVKNPLANAGDLRDMRSTPGWGTPGVGNGNLFQYSCLENSMDREAWQATEHGESDTTEHTPALHDCSNLWCLFYTLEVACNLGWAQTLSACPESDNVSSESWMSGFHHLKAFLSLEFYSLAPTILLFSGTLNLKKNLFYLTSPVSLGRNIGLLALIPVQKSWLGLLHKIN